MDPIVAYFPKAECLEKGTKVSGWRQAGVKVNYLYNSDQLEVMEKLENIVRVSKKGQIVIPKEVRERLGIRPGGKLAVIVSGDEIVLKKVEKLRISEISSRISSAAENFDVDELVTEAVEWARRRG